MYKTMLLGIICFISIGIPKFVFSQYQVAQYNTDNGLPSNGIKGLQWDDSTGFLWIATEAGIVRYNGISFTTFDINTNPEFGSNRIVCLIKNYSGNILAGGEAGNLSLINENKISLWFNGAAIARYNYNYYCAAEASDTLFKQSSKNPWPQKFPFNSGALASINDTAWVVLLNDSLFYYSVSTIEPIFLKTAPIDIKRIFLIDSKLYFINAANELIKYDIYENKFIKQVLSDEDGKTFELQKSNNYIFWQTGMQSPVIIQKGKAWILEQDSNNQLQVKLIANNIPKDAFFKYAVYNKKMQYLFLGSASKGLYIIHKYNLTSKRPIKGEIGNVNSMYSQIELPNGNIITSEGKIFGETLSLNNFNIDNSFLHTVFSLNDSEIIFSKRDSFYLYNRNSLAKQFMFKFRTNGNFALTYSGEDLYLASDIGVGIIKNKSKLEVLKSFDEKTSVHLDVADMTEISPGILALATCDGLFAYNIKTNRLDTLLKLPTICIRTLHKEGDYMFIGTYGGGYYLLKNGVIKAMPLDKEGSLKYAHCFLKDKDGFLWISTNNGLIKAKLNDLLKAYEKNIQQVYYHYFGKDDGMVTTEMNGGCIPCAIKLRNGTFSFPTMDGLIWFNPLTTKPQLPFGKIYVDNFIVDDEKIIIFKEKPIELPENLNRVIIQLAINAWCKKENLYIDYKLNDGKWFPVEMNAGKPIISFNNLDYGDYVIYIRKLNGFGISNYSYATIPFTIATPYFHQWWFRILVFSLMIGMVFLIFKIRLRHYAANKKKLERLVENKTEDLNAKNIQLEKNNNISLRLISIINHDIMTPLKYMHYAGKTIVENNGMMDENQKLETIAEITQTAKEMEQLSAQILNWIIYHNPNQQMQKEDFNLHKMVETIFRVLQFSAKEKNTSLINKVPVNFVICQYLEPMHVMIYNLVVNSLSFTRNGTITIKSNMENNNVLIEICDTGLGMTREQIQNILSDERIVAAVNVDHKKGTGLGYLIIKDLMKMMDAEFYIQSEKQKGTKVTVYFYQTKDR